MVCYIITEKNPKVNILADFFQIYFLRNIYMRLFVGF